MDVVTFSEGVFEGERYNEIIEVFRNALGCIRTGTNKKIEEYIIYGTNSCEFIDISCVNGKIIDPERYFKRLTVFDHGLGLKIDRSIFRGIVETVISSSFKDAEKIAIRTAVKLFVAPPGEDPVYNMGWHYDYYGGRTFTLEFFNDIDPKGVGRLSVARNMFPGRKRPFRPGNTEDVIVDPYSITGIDYIKNGLVMFDGCKGTIVHRPGNPPPNPKSSYSKSPRYRVLLQIVVKDDW